MTIFAVAVVAAIAAGSEVRSAAAQAPAAKAAPERLVVYGDLSVFYGPNKPNNCTLKSRYTRGEPVGFRIFAVDRQTGQRIDREGANLVVHLQFAGATKDIPMRYRGTAQQPNLDFWVAKWIVPDDAPVGIVRYTVTVTDKNGSTGSFKPFDNDQSQLTIVE